MLNYCTNYSKEWKFTFNTDKCTILKFGQLKPIATNLKWYIENIVLEIKNEQGHLGNPLNS